MFLRYLLVTLCFILVACGGADKIDTSTAEGAYQLGLKYEKDERYEEAITYFSDVKNKYPYSHLAISAELKIADINFLQENYPEAETAYKLFKEFHPENDQIDYVTYQLGLSVYNQLPPTIDRDLSLAPIAIGHFNQVINNFPKSKFVAEAKEHKKKSEKMLADKVNYIAQFYFKREKWNSALGRYEDLMKNHPGMGYDASALFGATMSAYKMKEMDKAKTYFKRLLAEYPNSSELQQARKELSDGF